MIHFFHYARWNVKVAKSKVRMRNETKLMARASFEGVTFWKGLGRERFLWVWFWMHILRKGARTEVVCKRTIWCREEKESANWRFRNEKTWRKNWALEWSGWKEKIWKSKRRRRNLLILTRLETRAKELSNGASRQGRETLRTKRNREEWNQVEGGGEEQKKKFGKRLENSFDGSFWWYCWRKEKNDERSKNWKKIGIGELGFEVMKELISTQIAKIFSLPFVDGRDTKQEFDLTDPKDGELWQWRVKPGETLVEARRSADVQIAFQTLLKGRKTHRTI